MSAHAVYASANGRAHLNLTAAALSILARNVGTLGEEAYGNFALRGRGTLGAVALGSAVVLAVADRRAA